MSRIEESVFNLIIIDSTALIDPAFLFWGSMELIRKIETRPNRSGKNVRWAIFKCNACGAEVEKDYQAGSTQKTCGCVFGGKTSHGDSKSVKYKQLYQKWASMRSRCYDERNKRYYRYGGRGITVCEEWKYEYLNFKHWALDNGYSGELQIDRIDNDGNYEPGNCRFVTNLENCRNSSMAKLNPDKVCAIKDLHDTGKYRYEVLADIFDISRTTIARVIRGESWQEYS